MASSFLLLKTRGRWHRIRRHGFAAAAGVLFAGVPVHAALADAIQPLPLSGSAYAVAQQAQRDYDAHRYADSATQAHEAIRQRPDVLSLRLLLANALAAGGHLREAIQAIDEARHDLGNRPELAARRQQIVIAGRPFVPTPAYRAAQAAYRAYGQQDFSGAEAAARHALNLDPNALPVHLLLVDALAAQHKDAQAYTEIQTALALASSPLAASAQARGRVGASDAPSREDAEHDLAERQSVVGARLAIPAATASALALKNGDSNQAVAQAKTAMAYAPDDPTYREQLIAALFAAHQPEAAADAATQAMTLHSAHGASDSDPSGASFWVWRAFAQAQLGANTAALADAQTALQRLASVDLKTALPSQTAPNAAADIAQAQRTRVINARLSLADLALVLGDAEVAKTALQPLYEVVQPSSHNGDAGDGGNAIGINAIAVTQRWHEAMQLASGQHPALARLYPQSEADTSALASGLTPRLSQWAEAGPEQKTTVSSAAPRSATQIMPPILDCTLSTYGPACMSYPYDPAFAAYQRGARAFDQGDHEAAVTAAQDAVRIAPADATHQMLLIDALHAAGQDAASRRVARQAVDAGLLDALPDLQGAYVASAANRPQLAAPRFQRADAQGLLPPSAFMDAGYASLQAGADPAASTYFKRAIDADDNGTIHMIPGQLLDTRRTESDIDRRAGVTVSAGYRPGIASGLANNPGSATSNRSLQTSVEGYWRPWGYMAGHTVELYARVSDTPWTGGNGATANAGGPASLSGAVGVRGRPFASQDLVVALERDVPLGSQATSDWLARLAYSNGFGTTIRNDVPSWWTATFYGEVGRYLNAGKDYWTAESDVGRSYRVDASHREATVFPYIVIGGDYNQLSSNGYGIGVGPGVTGRYDFREDRYHAPQSYVQGSVQYRFRVAGDERAQGWFVSLSYGY